ncbi:MAG: SDR family oxidoreductase [Acidimicrobiia bacterium]|nr:SDR family oxidoreductase [Acidimicrobiia bacterium]
MEDLFSVAGKVCLVTGGASGIGRMIAQGYVEAGATVYIASRKADVCREVAAELSELGTCHGLGADLSSEQGCLDLAAEIAGREDRVHVLVNNAGATWGAPLEEYPDSAWDKLYQVNVKSPFTLTRALLPQIEAAAAPGDPGRVINIGSVDGLHAPVMETYAYAATKAGVLNLTRALAKHLARRNITVNAVAPGPFESRMMAATLEAFGPAIAAGCPMGRIGTPEDMAGVAIYLASRAGAWVTGDVIVVDGGMTTTM